MTPEERSLLERTYQLAEENNEILRKMRRINRFSFAMRALYWIVVIGLAVGALYFIQPYVDAVTDTYSSLFGGNEASAQQVNPGGVGSLLDLL